MKCIVTCNKLAYGNKLHARGAAVEIQDEKLARELVARRAVKPAPEAHSAPGAVETGSVPECGPEGEAEIEPDPEDEPEQESAPEPEAAEEPRKGRGRK